MRGRCGKCCHWRGLMFLRPNQQDYFPGSGSGSVMVPTGLSHAYETTFAHLCHFTTTFPPCLLFLLLQSFQISTAKQMSTFMHTFNEGSLHMVASVTSPSQPLHREGELLRESNSAVREESCLHCGRRRCGRGARLQKGRKKNNKSAHRANLKMS